MFTSRNNYDRRAGLSLTEVIIASVILSIAVLGTSGFRYHAQLDARRADVHIGASRTALMLCEGWRGLRGSESYDPVSSYGTLVTIANSTDGPASPSGYTHLGTYSVTSGGVTYYTTLSWQDVSVGLRTLNVASTWEQRGHSGVFEDVDKTFSLTTYAYY